MNYTEFLEHKNITLRAFKFQTLVLYNLKKIILINNINIFNLFCIYTRK